MKTNSKEEFAEKWFWKQPRFDGMPRFHFKNEIYFVREKDGSVTVIQVRFFPETNSVPDTVCEWHSKTYFDFNVPDLEWCSVLAAVSKEGSSAISYEKAKELHHVPYPKP